MGLETHRTYPKTTRAEAIFSRQTLKIKEINNFIFPANKIRFWHWLGDAFIFQQVSVSSPFSVEPQLLCRLSNL